MTEKYDLLIYVTSENFLILESKFDVSDRTFTIQSLKVFNVDYQDLVDFKIKDYLSDNFLSTLGDNKVNTNFHSNLDSDFHIVQLIQLQIGTFITTYDLLKPELLDLGKIRLIDNFSNGLKFKDERTKKLVSMKLRQKNWKEDITVLSLILYSQEILEGQKSIDLFFRAC